MCKQSIKAENACANNPLRTENACANNPLRAGVNHESGHSISLTVLIFKSSFKTKSFKFIGEQIKGIFHYPGPKFQNAKSFHIKAKKGNFLNFILTLYEKIR